jgi:DNA-binding transcriptional LysR family regulator
VSRRSPRPTTAAPEPPTPSHPELRALDLNLLVVLDALLQEQSISRAAERLACGQPAVSKKLATLRVVFDDPLLVRQGRQMVPTPRALQLAKPLADALGGLGRAIAPPDVFRPETARGCIRLGLRYTGVTILPELVARLHARAPGLDLHVQDMRREEPQQPLARGAVDLILQPGAGQRVTSVSRGQVRTLAPYLYSQRLYGSPWVAVVRRGHPLSRTKLTLERYVETPHILISMRGDAYGFVDAVLNRKGKSRRIALMVPSFTEAFMHAATTDYILTSHLDLALAMQPLVDVRLLELPVRISTGILSQVWHERTAADPLLRWVRQLVFEIGRELDARYRKARSTIVG